MQCLSHQRNDFAGVDPVQFRVGQFPVIVEQLDFLSAEYRHCFALQLDRQ